MSIEQWLHFLKLILLHILDFLNFQILLLIGEILNSSSLHIKYELSIPLPYTDNKLTINKDWVFKKFTGFKNSQFLLDHYESWSI